MTPVAATWNLLKCFSVDAFRRRLRQVGMPYLALVEPSLLQKEASVTAKALEADWAIGGTNLEGLVRNFGGSIGLSTDERDHLVSLCNETLPHDSQTEIAVSAAIDEIWNAAYRPAGHQLSQPGIERLREVVPEDRWGSGYMDIREESGTSDDDPRALAPMLFQWLVERQAVEQIRSVLEWMQVDDRRRTWPRLSDALSRLQLQ